MIKGDTRNLDYSSSAIPSAKITSSYIRRVSFVRGCGDALQKV